LFWGKCVVKILTFEDKQFVLEEAFHKTPISSIKEAARFKSVADSKAKNILKRYLLTRLPVPSGGFQFPPELFPFQRNLGIPHILKHNRSFIAHAPGLGKSAQAITAVSMKPGKTLIICPAFLVNNWAREITKWSNGFPTISKGTDHGTNWDADFIIISDALLLNPRVRAKISKHHFKFIFIDEGHRFKTPDASRTVALFGGKTKKISSRGLIYTAEHVSILSGTPMLNRAIELWPILYAMAPETIDFMEYEEFGFHFGGPTRNEYGWQFLGSSNEGELKARIQKDFMQVLKKEDVLPDLPKKIREVILVDEVLPPKVARLDNELLRRLGDNFEKPPTLGEYAVIRHELGLRKVDFTSKFVAHILESDESEKIILYAYHRDVVEMLRQGLSKYSPLVINGGVEMDTRTAYEDAFQNGKSRIIIGNIHAMNLGLTLTAATRVVFCEYDWTPSNNEQAEDRANRIGSKWSVFCQYVVFPYSIDEAILKATLIKDERIKKVIG
jgi:SWI/SNF-related matrix-associated actin-dependent regulator 1 of chromatin subfamily A